MLKGIFVSVGASFLFGFLYYYSTLLQPLSGQAIFGYRVALTVPFIALAVFLFRQKSALLAHFQRLKRKPWLILVLWLNSSLMAFQMWLFLWAPSNGSGISVSLGYLLLPLVMVLCGRLLFKEYISKLKMFAILLAGIGVFSNIILRGGLSWECLAVSLGYTAYFSLRKKLKLCDLSAFAMEVVLMLPIAFCFIAHNDLVAVKRVNPDILILLFFLGLISGIALIAYIIASNLLPMNLLGLLGYVEPIIMLFVSLIIGETIDSSSYPLLVSLCFAFILLILDGITQHLRTKRMKIKLKESQ